MENVLINKSNNDGIDLSNSYIRGNNVKIYKSNDKGISIGEKSNISFSNILISCC